MKKRILYILVLLSMIPMGLDAQVHLAPFMGALATTVKSMEDSDDDQLLDAVQLYTDGRYLDAVNILKKLTTEDPKNDAAWYYRGLCEVYLGNTEVGQSYLKKASELDPNNYWYRERLAVTYSMTGNKSMTISEYEKLLKDFPKKVDLYYSLVNLYVQNNQMDKALSTLDEIETVMGKSDATAVTRYQILMQQQKPEEALAALKEFNDEYSSPQVLTMLGDHEIGMFNDSLALNYYNEALDIDSDYSPARLGKVEVFRLTRKYPEFFSHLDNIIGDDKIAAQPKADYLNQLQQHMDGRFFLTHQDQMDSTYNILTSVHPKDSTVLQSAGLYYYRSDRKDKAREYFKKNMECYPTSSSAALTYIQLLIADNDYEAIVEASDEASSRFPGDLAFIEASNYAHYNLGHYDKLIENSKKLLANNPDDNYKLYAYSTLGDTYHQMGDMTSAYKAYEAALKINPDYAPVLNNYAYYLACENKQLKKALKMSKKTIEQEPDNATYLDTYAWILHLLGNDKEAKPIYKHAMLYGGKDSAEVLRHYAVVLEKLGENELAEVYRDQAAAKDTEEEEK